MVQRTISSDERRELRRAAGCGSWARSCFLPARQVKALMSGLVVTIVGDIFKEGVSATFHHVIKGRVDKAKAILLEELEKGSATLFDVSDVDEVAAMVFEYITAAQRGAARMNLRILAQVFSGIVSAKPVYADDFLRWSSDLSTLSREEAIALGVIYKNDVKARSLVDVKQEDRVNSAFTATREELIGPDKLFKNDDEFGALFGALVRTGLVVPWPGFDNLIYSASEKLRKLMSLADIESAAD